MHRRPCRVAVVAFVCLLASSARIQAGEDAPAPMLVTPLELAAGNFELKDKVELADGDATVTIETPTGVKYDCKVKVTRGKQIQPHQSPEDCPGLWGAASAAWQISVTGTDPDDPNKKKQIEIRLPSASTHAAAPSVAVKLGRPSQLQASNAAVLGDVWVLSELRNGELHPDVSRKDLFYATAVKRAYGKAGSSGEETWLDFIGPEHWPSGNTVAADEQPCPEEIEGNPALERHALVAAEVSDQGNVRFTEVPPGGVIAANRLILVRVKHPTTGFVVSASMDKAETVGLTEAQVDTPALGRPKASLMGAGTPQLQVEFTRTCFQFAPRKPGGHQVQITTNPPKEEPKEGDKRIATAELIVEQPYLAAIRLGTSFVMGDARQRSFKAKAVGSSPQNEIVQEDSGAVDPELVAGFSLYLEPLFPDRFFDGGRTYNEWRKPPGVCECIDWLIRRSGIYVGLGLVGKQETIIDGFQSFYSGLEIEITQDVSVAVAAVTRRTEHLDGVRVGDAVKNTENIPLARRYDVGFGILVNLSSEFFKLASTGAGLFQ